MHLLARALLLFRSVNIFDAIIIYLACGAPFGVYYFLHNRERMQAGHLTLKTVLDWVTWPSSAVKMIGGSSLFSQSAGSNFDALPELDAATDEKVLEIQKSLERTFFDGPASAPISIYMFREVFDRYTGLSAARREGGSASRVPEAEIFRVADHRNIELASICLNRRNRSLLVTHHNQAREDFIDTLDRLAGSISQRTDTWILINELAVILDDIEAIALIDKIFTGAPQIKRSGRVKEKGEVLWKPGQLKQSRSAQPPLNLQPVPATMKLAKED